MRYVPCIALVWGKHIQCVAWQMKMLKFLIFILQHYPRDSSWSVVQGVILFSGKSWPPMGVSPWPPCVQPLMHGSLRNDQTPFWTLNAAWYSICIHVLSSTVTAREHPSQKHTFNQDMLIMITYIRKPHRTWRKTLKKMNLSKSYIWCVCRGAGLQPMSLFWWQCHPDTATLTLGRAQKLWHGNMQTLVEICGRLVLWLFFTIIIIFIGGNWLSHRLSHTKKKGLLKYISYKRLFWGWEEVCSDLLKV